VRRFVVETAFALFAKFTARIRPVAAAFAIITAPRTRRRFVFIFVVEVGEQGRLAVELFFVRLDDVVEPFTDRHAGLARGFAGGFARFWTEAS
jgi:hypothetical protein